MKLNVALHIGNEREYINECLEQVEKIADQIIIVLDTKSYDGTKKIIKDKAKKDKRYEVYSRKYDGTPQKLFNLSKCPKDEWVLFLDGDEILSDNCLLLKELIEQADKDNVDGLDIKGHHFIHNLTTEDAQFPIDYWHGRLFKNTGKVKFEGKNHAMTTGIKKAAHTDIVKIFHMGYVKHLQRIIDRYQENINYGYQIHTPQYLESWKNGHILGGYPTRTAPISELPSVLRKKFALQELDEILYFNDRQKIEVKHFRDAAAIFSLFNPKKVLFEGAGFGQRAYALSTYGVNVVAHDKSLYAVRNSAARGLLMCGDITKINWPDNSKDLVVAYDVLEHLTDKELDKAIKELVRVTNKYVLVSVPFLGMVELDADPTHIQKHEKIWWYNKLKEAGLKMLNVPREFPYHGQIFIGEKIAKKVSR